MKKLLCFISVIVMVLTFCVSAYAADTHTLSFDTPQHLGSVDVNEPCSFTIKASGGVAPYTYTISNTRYFPPGLRDPIVQSTDDDGNDVGIISGTPTSGGVTYCNMKVTVTDDCGCTAEQAFRLTIIAKKVDFEIRENIFFYNGLEQSVEGLATATVNGSAPSEPLDIDYTGHKYVGNYALNITVNTPGYILGTMSKSRMYIVQNPFTKVNFGERELEYNTLKQSPIESVTTQQDSATGKYVQNGDKEVTLPYTATYSGTAFDGTAYGPSEDAPIEPGSYRVSVTVDDTNFATPSANSTTFEIVPNPVDFTFNDTKKLYYYDDRSNVEYLPSDALVKDEYYSVKLLKDGEEYTKDTLDVGVYTVQIDFTEEKKSYYSVNSITPQTITVEPKPVDFDITDNPKEWTGSKVEPTITPTLDASYDFSAEDYQVTYYKAEDTGMTTPVDPIDKGDYIIDIDILDDNYTIGNYTKTFTVYQEGGRAIISLKKGNSVVAKLMSEDTDAAAAAARQSFIDGGYMYNGKAYNKEAWLDQDEETDLDYNTNNLDMDKNALFMYNGVEVELPGVSALGYNGEEDVAVEAVLKKGDTVIKNLTGLTTYTPVDLPFGIYTIEYSIAGDTSVNRVVEPRNVVVLWQLGDVNFDKNVNSIDGNYIMANYDTMPITEAEDRLFKYRMCDVTMDGSVGEEDRDAIYSRIVAPIAEKYYYPTE